MPAPTRIGDLRHSIIIQRYTATQNGLGEEVRTWAPLLAARAAIEATGGDGRLETAPKQDLASVSYRIRIRYRSDITAGMRVLIGAAVYDIEAVLSDTARREVVDLACKAVQ